MPENKITKHGMSIVIENPRGSYKSFTDEGDPLAKEYPLKGVTYPVHYGFIEGYTSEDGEDLDIFVGTGDKSGYIKVWRNNVPVETKFIVDVTEGEWNQIVEAFSPVIIEKHSFEAVEEFKDTLNTYKAK